MRKLFGTILLLTAILIAAPMDGDPHTLKQPDGTDVIVHYYGDEFYATMESPDGFTLVRNDEGWISYASLNNDGTDFVAGERYNGETGRSIRSGSKHLRLNLSEMRQRIDEGREIMRVPSIAAEREQFAQRRPIQSRGSRSVENVVGLTIVIDFPDQQSSITDDDISAMLNDANYTEYQNTKSVRGYFTDVSNGQMDYSNIVVRYTTINNKSYYDKNLKWMSPSDAGAQEATQKVMIEALEGVRTAGFDFSQLTTTTSNYGTYFRALNFFYEGKPSWGWGVGLWPHKWGVPYNSFVENGVQAGVYQITNIGDELSVGTFIHESGHVLCDYPDLYPYSGGSNVIQKYCQMSSSASKNPIPYNGYFRALMGWMNLTDISTLQTGREYELPKHTHMYYETQGDEAFYIENAVSEGGRSNFPGEGMMIWQVNESGSNSDAAKAGGDFLLELVQADGLDDMGNGMAPDAGDFYNSSTNTIFNESGNPQADWSNGAFSGIDIRNISESKDVMTFTIGEKSTVVTYSLTVVNGTGSGDYEAAENVAVAAKDSLGYTFTAWTGDTGVLSSTTSKVATVTMPASTASITATYTKDVAPTFALTVVNGTGSGDYEAGAEVPVIAKDSVGYTFTAWTGDIVTLSDASTSSATVTMPSAAVEITATYTMDEVLDTTNLSINLVDIAGWEAIADNFGSTGSVDSNNIENDEIGATLTQVEDNIPAEEYAWVKMSGYLDSTFNDVTIVKVTYKSDKAFTVVLEQELLSDAGTAYTYELPKSLVDTTVYISISKFEQPKWEGSLEGQLELNKVTSISFSAIEKGATTTLSISELQFTNYPYELLPVGVSMNSITSVPQSISIVNNGISLQGFDAGVTELTIYGLNGRVLWEKSVNITESLTHLSIPSLAQGVVILQIQGVSSSMVQRLAL